MHGTAVVFTILCTFFSQISRIESIACFTCIDCGDPFNAQSPNVSQTPSVCAYCYKLTVYMTYAPRYVVKECVQSCSETGSIFGGASLQVNCCTGSFCNHAERVFTLRQCLLIVAMLLLIDFLK